MIAFLRLAVFGLVGMTIAYWLLRIYFRSTQREELEKEWAADHPDGGDPDERDAYIEVGMEQYGRSLRAKLIWLVFVIPTLSVLVLLFLMNQY
jgi:hypothetical protein